MKIIFYLFFFIHIVSRVSYAQLGNFVNPRSQALGEISICLADVWSSKNNPATMLYAPSFEWGVGYQNRFLIPELSTQAIAIISPPGKGRFGGCLSHFGNSAYHENNFNLSYAHLLGNWLSAGICMAGSEFKSASGETSSLAVIGNFGLQAIPVQKLYLGLLLKNITYSKYYGLTETEIPTSLLIGMAYFEPSKYLLATQIDCKNYNTFNLSMGVEYYLVESLVVRLGIMIPQPANFTFGMGTHVKRLQFDIGFSQHQILGLSSSLSLTFKLGKNV